MRSLYIIIITMFVGACSLDESPKYTLNTNTVFSSEETTTATIMQAYGHLADIDLYGRLLWVPTLGNGTMIGVTNGNALHRASLYDVDPNDETHLGAAWRKAYKVIAETNYIIDGLKKSELPEIYRKEGMAQAHFLRGYTYYLIGSLWGNAPLITIPISSKELHTPISSRKQIYAQAEKDLLLASENLSEKDLIKGGGTATKNTAIAYLAKLYFMLASQKQAGLDTSDYPVTELWVKTKNYADQVLDKYALEPQYAKLFTSHLKDSKEAIFQLNYTTSASAGVQKRWNQFFAPQAPRFNSKSPAFRNIRMSKAFYDFHIGTHPQDKRIEVTYMSQFTNSNNVKQATYPYYLINGNYVNLRDYMISGSDPKNPRYDFEDTNMPQALRGLWKATAQGQMGDFMFPFSGKASDKNAVAQYDTRNTILFRYADLLLLLADAENELGNTNVAEELVNKVLKRAGVNPVSAMSKDQMRDFIFFERMFEFAGEPILFEDIRRRGTEYLRKVIDIQNNSWIVNYRYDLEKSKNIGGNFNEIIVNDKNLTDDFLRKALLLPIPLSEINRNEKIQPSDQNFGY